MEASPSGPLNARPVLWAERLAALDAIWLALRAAATGEEVRFDEHRASGFGPRLAGLFGFVPARLTLARADENGDPLNDRREKLLSDAVTAFASERLAERPRRTRTAFTAYYSGKLLTRATFLVMAQAAANDLPGREHRFFVVPHPANGLLARAFGLSLVGRPALSESLRQLAAPFVLLAKSVFAALAKPAVRHNLTGKPAVWTEYYHADLGGYISRLFWKDFVDANKWDRAVYMDRGDSPCDAEQIRRVEAAGLRWIDTACPWALAGIAPTVAARLLTIPFKPGLPWWARAFELHYETTVSLWEAAFRRFHVKLISQHQELLWYPVAQAEAIERAGGAMFGLHWSDFPFLTEVTHPSPEHVYFVWGVTNKRWLEGKGHDCRFILPLGLWLPSDPKASGEIRASLGKAEFTLAIFDSSYAYDIFYSAETLAAFLDAVLSLIEAHPGWKAVFKPKSPRLYEGLPGGAALMSRLEALRAAGQLVLLTYDVSPIDAALAADLSVCFGFNSAGVVSGARGARAVHWNAAGWTKHPLRADPGQKIMFSSLPAFKAAIEAAPTDPAIGDFSRWRRLADHFGDGRAAERVGEWISDALATSADEASARYLSRHAVGPEFTGPGHWWRD